MTFTNNAMMNKFMDKYENKLMKLNLKKARPNIVQ